GRRVDSDRGGAHAGGGDHRRAMVSLLQPGPAVLGRGAGGGTLHQAAPRAVRRIRSMAVAVLLDGPIPPHSQGPGAGPSPRALPRPWPVRGGPDLLRERVPGPVPTVR